MSYTLLKSTTPKARKDHKCIWCGQKIPARETYIRESSVYDGEMQDHKWHRECHEAALAYFHDEGEEEFDAHCNERPEK